MDCDDVMLVLADARTLNGIEANEMHSHLETCAGCSELAHSETAEQGQRWIAWLPEDAFEDPDLLVLPVIDPIVFTAGNEIAAGGMGKITRARDRRLGRDVAIKEMLAPELRARFEREATITARLQHPAIVPIYEAGTWPNGNAFYTMRLVEGGTLAMAIEGAKTLVERLALLPHVVAVTEALAYAHSRRIIHRDVKPQNVLVGEFGETVVIDWGLAKELDRRDVVEAVHAAIAPELTLAGTVIGTPCFMAPEQARGDDIDERADVFALGAILYNVLAGQPPYWDQPRDTAEQLIEAVLARPPTPIRVHAPDASVDLRAIAERAMARDPSARFASAKEMAVELRRFQAGQLLVSREYSLRDHVARWVKRHKAPVAVGALFAVALAVVAVVAFINVSRSRDAERSARMVSDNASHEIGRSVAALLEEQGRTLFVTGQREQALAYLAESYSRGRDTPSLRYLLAATTRDLDLLTATVTAPGDVSLGEPAYDRLAFLADHTLLAAALGNDGIRLDTIVGGQVSHSVTLAGTFMFDAIAPDGHHVIALDGDHAFGFDATTGAQLWTVPADASQLVFGGSQLVGVFQHDDAGLVLDVATGATVQSLPATAKVTAIAFDPDAKIIFMGGATGGCDFYVHEPAPKTGWSHIHIESGFELQAAAFVGRGVEAKLALATKKNEVLFWSLDQLFHAIGGHPSSITSLVASPNHRRFATAGVDGDVKLWDLAGKLVGELETKHRIDDLVFSHDATMLVGSSNASVLDIWNFALGSIGRLRVRDHEFVKVTAIAFDRDDSQIATIDDDGRHVHLWKVPKSSLVAHARGTALAVADRVAVVAVANQLEVFDLATGKKQKTITMASVMRHRGTFDDLDRSLLQVTADGARALVVGKQVATAYDLETGLAIRELAASKDNEQDSAFELTPEGKYIVEYGDAMLRLFEVESGKLVFEKKMPEYFGERGGVSPDGSRVVIASQPPLAFAIPSGAPFAMAPIVFDKPKNPRDVGEKSDADSAANDVTFSRDGSHILMLGVSAPVLVTTATGKTERTLHLLPVDSTIWTAHFDASGWRVVTQGANLAALWDTATGNVVFTVPDVADHAVAITRDGTRIATGTNEGIVRIWDGTGRLLDELRGHHGVIRAMSFSADGTRLVVQAADFETTFWDVHLEQRSPATVKALATAATGFSVVDGSLTLRKSP